MEKTKKSPPADPLHGIIFGQYRNAAGLGAMVELKLRLLASRTPELKKIAHDKSLENVETKVLEHFAGRFTAEEAGFLAQARSLRNKVLHSDFKSATTKAQEIAGHEPSGPGVIMLNLGNGEITPVSDTTKAEGGVFGWMLECLQTGVLIRAAEVFTKACEIYDRVTFEVATENIEPEMLKKMKIDKT